ncbi:DUF4328 domain-containing protein [Streptomyces sp. NBC_00316]|uniref:DUF4328 domain-containing protein n=1 Tax=Streptomyces sp. NBC_00316 TaxID=2975710 RepID=UPI002E29EDAC|nr:DUF4328 domain-containing protein [Streptomyces sp. NBC_00316]
MRSLPQDRLRSPVGLSYAVVFLIALCALTDLGVLLLAVHGLGVSGHAAGHDVDGHFDTYYSALTWFQVMTALPAGITFVVWLRRVRANAEVFRPHGHHHSRPWIFWGWFIPPVNFWYPRRIVLDVWRASTPAGPGGEAPRPGLWAINVWWASWLVGNVLSAAAADPSSDLMGTPGFTEAMVFMIAYGVFDMVAAWFVVSVVRGVTQMQDVMAHTGPAAAGLA